MLPNVVSNLSHLRDRVGLEIELRSRLKWDDDPTRLQEPVSDMRHGNI
jgi:hypothetical protein